MFIHRINRANRLDKWYDKRNSISRPMYDVESKVYYDFEVVTNHFYKTFSGSESSDKMLYSYNPVYSKEEGCLIRCLSAVLTLKHFEIEPGLYDLLIELEL